MKRVKPGQVIEEFPDVIEVKPNRRKMIIKRVNEILPSLKPGIAKLLMILDPSQIHAVRDVELSRLKAMGLIPKNLRTKTIKKNGKVGLYVYLEEVGA